MLNDAELTELVRATVKAIEEMTAASNFGPWLTRLKDAGIVSGMHVGGKNLGPRATLEWYAGQIIEVIQSKAWFAVNSLIGCVDKFAPVDQEHRDE